MQTALFDFDLPQERIALRPAHPRDSARLLQVGAALEDRLIRDLPGLLRPGDALVVNDTRVIPARLAGVRERGRARARIEATLHRRVAPDAWRAFIRPAKKLALRETVRFDAFLQAELIEKGEAGEVVLRFNVAGAELDQAIERCGAMPLPPYIAARRPEDASDAVDYQTIFAQNPGAVAAPTAGLHVTPELVAAIEARGVAVHRVTLHVGAGTFLPVKAEDTDGHKMHAEWGRVDAGAAQALNQARAEGGRVIAIGTTCLRILESAAQDGRIAAFEGETSIFITPGYRFQAVDLLLTNFHLPRSTLFMLVCAFSGLTRMRAAYVHAIEAGYRFYSYGDACLLERG